LDASTTIRPGYLRPVLIGGLVSGVLSALPLVQLANGCCCLWIVTGGVVAAYLRQQDQHTPLTPGDGAFVGLLAGLLGVVAATIISIPIDLLMGPISRAYLERLAENNENLRALLENAGEESLGTFRALVVRIAGFMVYLMVGGVFSTLGGLLGAVLFSRRTPPHAADQPFA
jgi:hypothetical protein